MEDPRILIVDDDRFVRRTVLRVLQSEGMIVEEASSGAEAIARVSAEKYDLILLDIIMEGMDGFQVVHQIRTLGITTPVFVLSGRQADNDKIFALGIGADDYITKPFSPSVLCAKVKACLRRCSAVQKEDHSIKAGPFCYKMEEMRLLKLGEEIPLSSKESFLMRYFLINKNKVLTKEQIYSNVWGNNVVDDNTIMVHIRRLRTKIEDDPNHPQFLRTIRGVGYQFCIE